MSSALYDTGRNAFLLAAINWTTDTIKVALVGAGYAANMATDQFFSLVTANVIGVPVQLTSPTAAAGVANAANVTTAAISTGSTVTQIVLYKDTGTSTTSQLIAREDVTSTPTNGGTFTITWDTTAGLKIFKL
jgi:hypothetical protein